MHRDPVNAVPDLGVGIRNPLGLQSLVDRSPRGTGIVGSKRSGRGNCDVHPARVLWIDDVWAPDLDAEAEAVFRTTSDAHPGVAHLRERTHPFYAGGRLEAVRRPFVPSFGRISPGPLEVRTEFARRGWNRIVAFHTRNPMHRAHFELTRQVYEECVRHDILFLLEPIHFPFGKEKKSDALYIVGTSPVVTVFRD